MCVKIELLAVLFPLQGKIQKRQFDGCIVVESYNHFTVFVGWIAVRISWGR